MILESTYENKNRKAFVYSSTYDSTYTVEYHMNGQVINRTHHRHKDAAKDLAEDFIAEAGYNPQFLNEEGQSIQERYYQFFDKSICLDTNRQPNERRDKKICCQTKRFRV